MTRHDVWVAPARRSAALFVLALLGVGFLSAPVSAVERGTPGERLVYSAPTTSSECGRPESGRDLVVASPAGGDPSVVASCVEDAEPPSPDGERLAGQNFTTVDGPARVTQAWVQFHSEDNGCRLTGTVGSVPGDDIGWSPDGIRVAAALHRSFGSEFGLYVQDLRDGSRRQLVAGDVVRWPTWHPTTNTIAYTYTRSATDHDIEVIGVAGTGRRTLIGGATDDAAPAFSPTGDRIAFVRGTGSSARPYVANADGSGTRRVADIAIRGTLSWTPDGTRLAVALTDGIATLRLSDGALTRLTTGDHLSPTIYVRKAKSGSDGYGLADANGRVFSFGAMCSTIERAGAPEQPYVAAAATPNRRQAWYVTAAGRVEPTGSHPLLGNAPAGSAPIVGIATTVSGNGYWLASTTGDVYTIGDATFFGSLGGTRLNRPIVGITVTPSARGYWLVASDGGIFSFGDAVFYGSTGAMRLNAPMVGMAATPTGSGYWLFAGDGGIFTFGDAAFHGSTGAIKLNAPVFAMAATTDGSGYWLFARDGGVFTFGGARFYGSTGDLALNVPMIASFNRGSS